MERFLRRIEQSLVGVNLTKAQAERLISIINSRARLG